MQCNIVINGQNLIDYKSFILFFSKAARKQYFINTFMIFTEAIIAGFVADMLLKSKIFTIIGAIFAIFWIIFYPIFLKRSRIAALKRIEISDVQKQMNFEVNEKFLAYYEGEPKENEKFDLNEVSEIYELKNIFIVFLEEKIHLIIPKDEASSKIINELAKLCHKDILKFENFSAKSVLK